MRTAKSIGLSITISLSTLLLLAANISAQTVFKNAPHNLQGCLSCHFINAFDEPNLIPDGKGKISQKPTLYDKIQDEVKIINTMEKEQG